MPILLSKSEGKKIRTEAFNSDFITFALKTDREHFSVRNFYQAFIVDYRIGVDLLDISTLDKLDSIIEGNGASVLLSCRERRKRYGAVSSP
jgi:hypothetical protein